MSDESASDESADDALDEQAAPIQVTPELLAQVAAAIAEVRPAIQNDGGDITFVKIEGDIVRVALSGACTHCGMAGHTLGGVRKRIAHATGLPLRVLPAIEALPAD